MSGHSYRQCFKSQVIFKCLNVFKLDFCPIGNLVNEQRLAMAEKNRESIKSRLRKPRVNQIENKTVPQSLSTENNHNGSLLIPTTAGVPEKISTTDSINIEIIDTPFDPENIIIQVTNQQPIQTQNTWVQEPSSISK